MPYVWGGTTDNTADGLPQGGYVLPLKNGRLHQRFAWDRRVL